MISFSTEQESRFYLCEMTCRRHGLTQGERFAIDTHATANHGDLVAVDVGGQLKIGIFYNEYIQFSNDTQAWIFELIGVVQRIQTQLLPYDWLYLGTGIQ